MTKKFLIAGLGFILLLSIGCNGKEAIAPKSEPSKIAESVASEETGVAASEKYVTADDDFGNLSLKTYDLPVYDRYTLSERREKNLPTKLPEIVPYSGAKVAYLTFDDGPDDKNTAAILDILAAEKIKATFYVLGKNVVAYPGVAGRIFEEGHAIGNHSYDHDYNRLYSSPENYLDEMIKTDEVLHELFGVRPLITRAPGGKIGNFNDAYENMLLNNGYAEHDWNVSSADAAPGHPTAQDFIDNIEGQADFQSAIILMHCSAGHEETVKALPEIIRVLREKNYVFGVVTPMTPQPW